MENLAKIVAITQPINECASPEDFVAFAARVSNPGNQNNTATAGKLLSYLIRNKHWSPFEMVSITMEINTTRDIGRQILRHRSFSFQEFSQRYAKATEYTRREPRLQDLKNRQNSVKFQDDEIESWWWNAQENVAEMAKEVYERALELNIAKEQARVVLPEGLTKTRMYMSGTLRSWLHYCDLRCGNGTQLEHKEIADAAKEALREYFPNVIEALQDVYN